jgi:hypothetical protein
MASDNISALLGQMASLANFMYVDGRDAFAVLPTKTKSELHIVFEALNEELQTALAETGHG